MLDGSLGRLRRLQSNLASALRGEGVATYQGLRMRGWPERAVHFWGLVARFFWRNRCQVRASALAYTTLLALVPMLAVSLSVGSLVFDTQSKESRDRLATYIERFVENVAPTLGLVDADNGSGSPAAENGTGASGQAGVEEDVRGGSEKAAVRRQEVASKILDYTNQIHFGTIGVTAMVGLIFVAISLLRTIEAAFNDIWGGHRGRGWFDSIILYWAAITLGPMVLLVAMTSGYLNVLADTDGISRVPVLGLLRTQLLPVVFLGVAFGVFYKIVPNTHVAWQPALLGGLVAGVLWWVNNKLGVLYNTKVVTYSKIYGSLGAVPLFLIGLYLSWLILLFGAQVAYVYQNRQAYLQEQFSETVHAQAREFVALRFMAEVGRRYEFDGRPPGLAELSTQLGVPAGLASQVLDALEAAHLVVETQGQAGAGYVPARPLRQILLKDVLYALRRGQGSSLATAEDACRDIVQTEFASIQQAEESRSGEIHMEDLIRRLPEPPPAADVRVG